MPCRMSLSHVDNSKIWLNRNHLQESFLVVQWRNVAQYVVVFPKEIYSTEKKRGCQEGENV